MSDENKQPKDEESHIHPDANPAEKDMMSEGAPPPEQAAREVSAEELDESVRIEVESEDNSAPTETVEQVEGGATAAPEDPIEALRAELAQAQAKADEYLDQMQRTAAEYQNSRRRQEKQMADAIERANGQLIKQLLPILDDFHLAFENVPAHLQPDNGENDENNGSEQAWVNGFRQIQKKLIDTLAEQGLEKMDTSGPFDPTLHEAISSEPSDSVESGQIIETLRAGYTYKGQVLRPALIRVAS
jgi:molecular chaperone GrpE